MLKTIIVSPDPSNMLEAQSALEGSGRAVVVRKLTAYPQAEELTRIIRAYAPHLVVLDTGRLEECLDAAAQIESATPGLQILAIGRNCLQQTLIALMRAGIREFLPVPFEAAELESALERIEAAVAMSPPAVDATDQVFAFLPAKPGVGCSVTSLNASAVLAKRENKKVLLLDFDLNCGMIGFMLRLDPIYCIVDAAEHAPHLDEQLWPKLVSSDGNLDVIPAGKPNRDFRIDPAQIRYLLEFARRNYQVICADLSGLMEKYSLEVMMEAKRIYLVCTPEIPALHLAREKLQMLRELDLEDRVRVVLNRAEKRTLMPRHEVEKLVGSQVEIELPNDYRGVYNAIAAGKPVNASSELGRSYHEFARKMAASEVSAEPAKRRFVDYFSLVPARFSFSADRGRRPA